MAIIHAPSDEIPISKIEINLKSRDDIPPLLLGLQHIYTTPDLRETVFKILEEKILPDTDHQNGRPGMDLWKLIYSSQGDLNELGALSKHLKAEFFDTFSHKPNIYQWRTEKC